MNDQNYKQMTPVRVEKLRQYISHYNGANCLWWDGINVWRRGYDKLWRCDEEGWRTAAWDDLHLAQRTYNILWPAHSQDPNIGRTIRRLIAILRDEEMNLPEPTFEVTD